MSPYDDNAAEDDADEAEEEEETTASNWRPSTPEEEEEEEAEGGRKEGALGREREGGREWERSMTRMEGVTSPCFVFTSPPSNDITKSFFGALSVSSERRKEEEEEEEEEEGSRVLPRCDVRVNENPILRDDVPPALDDDSSDGVAPSVWLDLPSPSPSPSLFSPSFFSCALLSLSFSISIVSTMLSSPRSAFFFRYFMVR